jgi:transposase
MWVRTTRISAPSLRADAFSSAGRQRRYPYPSKALIAHLKLEIAKLNRDRFGPRSERTARLLDQMEL